MNSDATTTELLERIEALENRVDELESEDTATLGESNGLDERDRIVLNKMRDHGVRSKVALANLYKSATDITKHDTAKRRAKNLEKHPAYKELANE